ncbi:hypothetical protein A3D71_00100 [Candidatus Kaiserbacteria bacterium RIFCSPHIGHO2_02_FULL_55_20]|uniref:Uncharacterized protein n=1 Tax=Candidatus Kaiserbacteria bacterium RIFCSPHIGHO2_02_FULL_55_20 TaxID=1798497 RepID=A0A1F6DV89_9BACT|nr:MAG: hypothetical protein A2680_01745 [Candidatus Kaiserbacteria bacterium RIFCSPHIGHO2_01_FULL_55_37]OGG65341.1 MAG: hypothetical protein A3D71_00100 [Candidatus Kaiserbacteria bacterium RIFCSPHIGHO2_02_FULL_55_20]
MSPAEFFEKAKAGSRIRYDKDFHMDVRITFISRLCGYAIGRQVGTKRRVYLMLSGGMLKEGISGSFVNLEFFS